MKKIARLIGRMATENPTWGYSRIQGALKNLDHRVARSTIAKAVKEAADFFTTEVWTVRGLVTYYTLFVPDLLDRFARSTLVLLPLRERPDDILPLARTFAARLAQRPGEVRRLTSDAENHLRRYGWPGNVRELSAVIERAVMRRSREEIGVEELGLPSI
jgi:sigma54-dependent transcription regulator